MENQFELFANLFGIAGGLIGFIIAVVMIASMWKIFEKAGEDGWKAIIPIYNVIVIMQIVGRPLWWIIGFFIPLVNLFVAVVIAIDLAKSFGKDVVMGLVIAFVPIIGYPMLGFGSAQYQGAAGGGGSEINF